jgi:glutathione S-transferase
VGERFGRGDIAVGTVLGYLTVRFPELDWRTRYANLTGFNARVEQRPSFLATVPVPQRISDEVV